MPRQQADSAASDALTIGLQDGTANISDVRAKAMDLLARREHSRQELTTKLDKRGYDSAVIAEVLDDLVAHGWLSDERYAEAYVRMRSAKGYGPLRIRNELGERGVSDRLIAMAFKESDRDWFKHAKQVRIRKFGEACPDDFKLKAKQSRFLQYRGFDYEQIHSAFETND